MEITALLCILILVIALTATGGAKKPAASKSEKKLPGEKEKK